MLPLRKAFVTILFITAICLFLVSLKDIQYSNLLPKWLPSSMVAMERVYEGYRHCMLTHPDLVADAETTWSKGLQGPIADCFRFGPITRAFRNNDETKQVILPKNMLDKCTLITLGVGQDVTVEIEVKKLMPNCEFHGVDPVDEGNKHLYEKVGKFYNHAIAGGSVADSSILTKGKYLDRRKMPAVPLYDFITKVVKQSVIEYMFIDCEYAEYDMLDLLLAKRAAQEGLTFCQINIEVHAAQTREHKVKLHRFFQALLEEGSYMLIYHQPVGHHRLFFYNWRSEECRRRFFEY